MTHTNSPPSHKPSRMSSCSIGIITATTVSPAGKVTVYGPSWKSAEAEGIGNHMTVTWQSHNSIQGEARIGMFLEDTISMLGLWCMIEVARLSKWDLSHTYVDSTWMLRICTGLHFTNCWLAWRNNFCLVQFPQFSVQQHSQTEVFQVRTYLANLTTCHLTTCQTSSLSLCCHSTVTLLSLCCHSIVKLQSVYTMCVHSFTYMTYTYMT